MPTTPISPPSGANQKWAGAGVMATSGLSNQTGAAIGALAFPSLGPAGVVAARQYVAAIVLLALTRPRVSTWVFSQWWPVVLLGTAFGAMNLFLYSAIDRIGLGLAVTLEFLGPLAIALASSRRRTDLCCAALAATGVVVLTRPQPTTDYTGIGLALLAAACWASYILLNRTVGRRLPGTEGSAAGAVVSALLFTPVGVHSFATGTVETGAVLCAAAAGVLSSAVPLVADLVALRRVPTHFFGLFMSANPVFAAVLGLFVLHQSLGWFESAAIVAITAANTISILTSRPPREALSTTVETRARTRRALEPNQ